METEAEKIFEAGLTQAEKAYSDTFEEEKGGVGTWLTTWGDDWKDLIERSLAKARREYLRQVDDAVDKVATYVETQLAAAKKRVGDGLKEVQNFVNGLDKSVAQFGQEALQTVAADFDAMRADIDERRDNLIDKLAQQYKDSSERMSAMETKLRDENKSLWQRVYDATVGLVKKILAFKDMLLGILAKAAGVISDIIDDPIGFLGNLVSAIAQGLKNFMANIGTHLKKGLMAWLFGALAGAGLQLPEAFDLKGIVSIVLQVLGLAYANFRARAVAIVGEPVVGALEKTDEVFKVLVTEGIPGIWRFIQEKVGDLKAMVLDAIFDFIKDSVIVAGIKWVIGLLNPASAFFKACMAIYDIVMFFINRGSQIIELVNAVTDSVAAIAKGALGAAAGMVEGALAKAIPVTIGFVAGLLGLGDISGTIKSTIDKAKAPINKAVDWVIKMASKGLKAAGKLLGFGKDKPDERTDEQKRADLHKGVAEATTLLENKDLSSEQVKKKLPTIKSKYSMTVLELVTDSKSETKETDHIHGEINPKQDSRNVEKETTDLERLKAKASQAIAEEVAGGLPKNQVPAAMERVKRRIVVAGTVDVRAEPRSNGTLTVSFHANDKYFPLGELRRALKRGNAPPGRAVESVTRIKLVSNHPITDLSSILPREIPPGGRGPNIPTGGGIVNVREDEIQMLTWNTDPSDKSPGSHAEAQTTAVFESKSAKEVLNYIESIEIRNFTKSACTSCSDALVGMLKQICGAQRATGQIVFRRAEIYWTQLFEKASGKDSTTWRTIEALARAGWTIHAPAAALPAEEDASGNVVADLAGRRPLSQAVVVIQGTIHC